jgi:hypothetical protein
VRPPWEAKVIESARHSGPHVSALTPDNIALICEDIEHQAEAGFIHVASEPELFRGSRIPSELKISRVAAVPQANRRGHCPVACDSQQHRRAEAVLMMMNDEVKFYGLSTAFLQRFETS